MPWFSRYREIIHTYTGRITALEVTGRIIQDHRDIPAGCQLDDQGRTAGQIVPEGSQAWKYLAGSSRTTEISLQAASWVISAGTCPGH